MTGFRENGSGRWKRLQALDMRRSGVRDERGVLQAVLEVLFHISKFSVVQTAAGNLVKIESFKPRVVDDSFFKVVI